jgi:hypothetical protein
MPGNGEEQVNARFFFNRLPDSHVPVDFHLELPYFQLWWAVI